MVNTKNILLTFTKMPFSLEGIFCLFLLLFSVSQSGHAQFFDAIEESLQHKATLDAKFDSRNSFIGARYARIFGVKLGLDYNDTFKAGIGYNWLSSDIYKTLTVTDFNINESYDIRAQYHLSYFAPYAEYVFYQDDPWEISILVLVGGGWAKYSYWDRYWNHVTTDPEFVFLYEPYMTAQYRLFKYVGVGAGVGYRLAMSSDRFSRTRLNSPIYVLKLKIYASDIYRDLKDR